MNSIFPNIYLLDIVFYKDPSFWINVILSLLGVFFSCIAFLEARQAKTAANDAAKAVKIQTITIELTEIIQRLDKLDINITYQDARDFYNEINRKVRRLISPYKNDTPFKEGSSDIFLSLDAIKNSLTAVRPFNQEKDESSTGNTVYYAVESDFSILSGKLAEICGLFEQPNI